MKNEESKPLFNQAALNQHTAKLSDGSEYIFTEHTALQGTVLTAESNIAETADEENELTPSERAAIYFKYQVIYTALSLEKSTGRTWQQIRDELNGYRAPFLNELYEAARIANEENNAAKKDDAG